MSDTPVDTTPRQPAPAPAHQPFRLMRIREGKVFGGVAGGIGRAAGIDPSIARLGVFAACLTGVGLLAYFVLWVVLPQEAPWRGEIAPQAPEPTSRYFRIGLAVASALGVLDVVGNVGGAWAWARGDWGYGPNRGGFGPSFGGGLGLLLIGFGAALLIARRRDSGPHTTVPTTPTGTWEPWVAGPGDGATADPGAPVVEPEAQPSDASVFAAQPFGANRFETGEQANEAGTPGLLTAARVFGWLVVVWSVLVAAAGFALWWAGALRPGIPEVSIPLGIVAFGNVVWTLIRSRRAGAIVVALLILMVPVTLAANVDLRGDLAARDLRPTDATVESFYRVAAGQLTLDLRDLDVPSGIRRVRVSMGAGQVTVRLPANVTSDVTARTHLGGSAVLGDVRGGNGTVGRGHLDGCPERGRLLVDIVVRVGHIEVEGPGGNYSPVCAQPMPADERVAA